MELGIFKINYFIGKNKLKARFRTKYGGLYGEAAMSLKTTPSTNPFS